MKFTPGPAIAAASGSIGGTVFSRNRYGAYTRNRAIPVNPQTTFQQGVRATLGNLSTAWSAITAGERLAWKEWANQNPIIDVLGQSQILAPNAAFISLNARMLAGGLAQVDTPPITVAPDALTSLTSEGDIGTLDFELNFTVTPLGADESLWVRAAVTNSPSITYVSNLLRFVGISAAAQATAFDTQSIIEARLGALIVGQTVHQWVSVLDRLSGQLSPPRRTSVVVTDTP